MRMTVSALWICIGILSTQATAAFALTDDCQAGDPYKEPDKVVETCSTLLDAAGISPSEELGALRQRAEAYYWAKRYESAFADLNAALDLDPKSVETLRRRGWTNIGLNHIDEAYADFTEALDLDGQNADTLFAIGFMLHRKGSAEAARKAYEQALAINSKQYLARAALSNLYFYYLNDADKAFEHIDAVVSASPDDVAMTRYKSFRDRPEAIDFYSDVRLQRARMLFNLKRLELALDDANWVIEKYPRSVGALELRADIRRHLRDDANALADADRALAIAPNSETSQIVKLYSLERLGRREELAEFANSVIDGTSTDNARGNAYFFRGEVLKQKNEPRAAIADMEQSFELAPFFLVATLQRMIARGYYDGKQDDGYSKEARVALEACMIDPEC